MVFDDTVGTYTGNDVFNATFMRKPLMINRDNSGFSPTYVQPSRGPHEAFIVIGVVLFAWLVLGHVK